MPFFNNPEFKPAKLRVFYLVKFADNSKYYLQLWSYQAII